MQQIEPTLKPSLVADIAGLSDLALTQTLAYAQAIAGLKRNVYCAPADAQKLIKRTLAARIARLIADDSDSRAVIMHGTFLLRNVVHSQKGELELDARVNWRDLSPDGRAAARPFQQLVETNLRQMLSPEPNSSNENRFQIPIDAEKAAIAKHVRYAMLQSAHSEVSKLTKLLKRSHALTPDFRKWLNGRIQTAIKFDLRFGRPGNLSITKHKAMFDYVLALHASEAADEPVGGPSGDEIAIALAYNAGLKKRIETLARSWLDAQV